MPVNQITEKIRKLLKNNNITIAELAAKLGISAYGLQKMFKANSYKVDTLQKIADALNVEIIVFFGGTSNDAAYNELNLKYESTVASYRLSTRENNKIKSIFNDLINFILTNTYYNELSEIYVKPSDFVTIIFKINKRMNSYKPYNHGYYLPFDQNIVSGVINSILFEYPRISAAFEKKLIKNKLLVQQYQEWKENPPVYPEYPENPEQD